MKEKKKEKEKNVFIIFNSKNSYTLKKKKKLLEKIFIQTVLGKTSKWRMDSFVSREEEALGAPTTAVKKAINAFNLFLSGSDTPQPICRFASFR